MYSNYEDCKNGIMKNASIIEIEIARLFTSVITVFLEKLKSNIYYHKGLMSEPIMDPLFCIKYCS